MKIYHLIENLDDSYGGPAKSVPNLVQNLKKLNVEDHLLSIKIHKLEKNEVIKNNNLNWLSFRYEYLKKLRYSSDLKNYLIKTAEKQKNVIFHAHNLWNNIPYLTYKLSQKYKIPYILSSRGALYPWSLSQNSFQKKIAWSFFQKDALNNATCIHATNVSELRAIKNIGILSPIALIPNGINLNEFKFNMSKNSSRKKLGLKTDRKYILFFSRIHPKKGLEYLVESWIKISNKFPNWNLLIVGPVEDQKYYSSIQKKLNNHNLNGRTFLRGMLKNEKRLHCFNSSDLFILPSHTENFGIAIAEAMASKLPVITTHGTPWQEIQRYDAGWWVKLSHKNIDRAIREALSSSDVDLKKKGINGYKIIKDYEWKYQAKKMKKVYKWMLEQEKKPDFIF